MIAIEKTNNRGKLLAAITVMALVVCAFAVIMPADDVSAAPSESYPSEATYVGKLTDLGTNYNEDTKTVTVPEDGLWINLTADIGSADSPVDVKFVLDGDLKITANTGCEMYVQYNGTSTENAYTISFNKDDTVFLVDGATVSLDVNTGKNSSVFNNMYPGCSGAVKVSNSGTLNVQHTGSGSTWLGAPADDNKNAWLIVDSSVVNFNGTNAIQEVIVDADNATINFNDVLVGMSVLGESTFDKTAVNVNGADLNGIFIKGNVTLTESNFNIVNASRTNENRPGLMIMNASSTTITMDDASSISAATIGVTDNYNGFTNTSTAVNISGGSITGEFTAPMKDATTPTDNAPSYNLGDTTVNGRSSIESGAKVTGTMTVGDGADLSVYGDLASATVENNGTIKVMDKAATIPEIITGSGSVDTSAITGYEEISGEIYDITTKGVGQTTTVVGDTVILAGSQLTIKGKLIINEGVTLTIEDGAQLAFEGSQAILENNGTILIQSDATREEAIGNTQNPNVTFGKDGGLHASKSATVENNGTIVADYALINNETKSNFVIVIGTNSILKNNGTVTVNDSNVMYVSGTFSNEKDSVFNLNGIMRGASGSALNIDNAGTVNIDGTIESSAVVNLTSQDASVNVTSLEVSGTSKLTVKDGKITSNRTSDKIDTGSNSVDISATNGSVGGISIKSALVKDDNIYYRSMTLSSAVAYTYTGEGVAPEGSGATIGLANSFEASFVVSETLTIGEDVTITLAGNMDVTGTMTLQNGSSANKGSSDGIVDVTGTVIASKELTNWTMNAAMYRTMDGTTPTYYYTTLENAVAAGATAITITGDITVLSDVTIPSGTTVTQRSGTFQIGNSDNTGVTVEVFTGGKIDQKAGTIDVDGTLFIENKSNGISRNAKIVSEVMSESGTSVTYTNLANAIATAGSNPVTITLNGGVEVTSDLVIPSNVTVDTNEKTFAVKGATLTIDGTLFLNGTTPVSEFTVTNTGDNVVREGKVVLNGYIKSNENLAYTDGKVLPAGAYYVGAEDSLDYITSVNNSQNIISSAEDATINIYGTNTAGDVAYTGTADMNVTINVNGKLTVSSITLQYADLVFTVGQEFDGSIATAEGEVQFSDAKLAGTFSSVSRDGAMVFSVTNADITAVNADDYNAAFTGNSTIAGSIYGMTVDGNVTAAGLTVTGDAVVNGTLIVSNGMSLDVEGSAVVNGTLAAAAATDVAAAGNASVAKLYVGIDPEDMSSSSEAPVVSGNVTAGIAYVLNGSTVADSIVKATGVKSTQFFIEDALWMTTYTANSAKANVSDAPVTNADFNGWKDENGKMIYYVEKPTDSNPALASDIIVGTPDKLYADIDYNIYSVNVTADAGIGTVAIDGVVLENRNGNIFTITGLIAGEHTLTYTLKSGYEGTATMYINGTSVSGYSFSLGGTDASDRTLDITLSGTTPSAGGSGSGDINTGSGDMSLTDILLIVLVVLILVMAIIVALRLMRS